MATEENPAYGMSAPRACVLKMIFNKNFTEPVLLQAEHAHAHNANPHFRTINLSASKLL